LLRDVSTLRLTLDTDLTVAAAAAEADRVDVAAEIVDFDRHEIAAFSERATDRLREPAAHEAQPVAGSPRARIRHRVALAAAPAMLAAAAFIAVVSINGSGTGNPANHAVVQPRLMASYSRLTELARSNKDPAALVAVGHELNDSLAQLIAAAAHDPAKARQALRILEAEQQVLTVHHPTGASVLLAQARVLFRELQAAAPEVVGVPEQPASRPSTAAAAPAPQPSLAVVAPTPLLPTPAPAPTVSPTPSPAAQSPTPEPSTGTSTVPPGPSPQPTFIDPWPFDVGQPSE
jgi:hypothetical protein